MEPLKMDRPAFIESLLVVIVLYGKTPHQSATYRSLRAAFRDSSYAPYLFIYDNSEEPSDPGEDGCHYEHNPANSGLGVAYNRAAQFGRENHKKWLLLFDQDTIVPNPFLEAISGATARYPDTDIFAPLVSDRKGLLSPFKFSLWRGVRTRRISRRLALDHYRFINSGLLLRLSAFFSAGGYNPAIPLDFSDICFAERLRNVTDHFVVVDIELSHDFADNAKVQVSDALLRYRYYCLGAAIMRQTKARPDWYWIQTFLRACRLFLRYRDRRFFLEYFQFARHG